MKNIQDDILDAAAKEFAQEIDRGILIDLFASTGWLKVSLDQYFADRRHAVDVQIWCSENFADEDWTNFGATFLFKNSADAEWFALRWMST